MNAGHLFFTFCMLLHARAFWRVGCDIRPLRTHTTYCTGAVEHLRSPLPHELTYGPRETDAASLYASLSQTGAIASHHVLVFTSLLIVELTHPCPHRPLRLYPSPPLLSYLLLLPPPPLLLLHLPLLPLRRRQVVSPA